MVRIRGIHYRPLVHKCDNCGDCDEVVILGVLFGVVFGAFQGSKSGVWDHRFW